MTDDDDERVPGPLLVPRGSVLPPVVPAAPPSVRPRSSLPPPSAPLLGTRRSFYVLGCVALALAAVGFFRGIAAEQRGRRELAPLEISATAPAPGYKELREMRRGPNANLYAGAFERFQGQLPAILADVPPQTEAQRAEVLTARSQTRAYDGAPPTIPHAVHGQATTECLACHEKGAIVAGKRAPTMSHERHDSCTQCHVSAGGPPSPPPPPLTSSTFVGQPPVTTGARAWAGAPPTIPHATSMRERCASCHGVAGALGMRSTHPWRESCTQCHAPSASLDQRPSNLPPVGGPPAEGQNP